MAYKNMAKNKLHKRRMRKLYASKKIKSMTEKERENLYMMMFNRKLPKRKY